MRISPRRGAPDRLDGLILGGGADVDPERYGERARAPSARDYRPARSLGRLALDYAIAPLIFLVRRLFGLSHLAGGIDRDRDALELALLARADREHLPVLGICRGAQLLGVHAGGTLHQDLTDFYDEHPNPWTVFPSKRAHIEPGSALARALGVQRCRVNSLHRQAVNTQGTLRVVARDDSQVVQAIERTDRPFWIGVQWHPEFMPQVRSQRRLLRQMVRSA